MGDSTDISSNSKFPSPPGGLDWVQFRQELEPVIQQEKTLTRLLRKINENPFVPIGATVTVGALTYGIVNFLRGNTKMQQKMMRLRVAAQLFTVVAAVGGVLFTLPKGKRNLEGLLEAGQPGNRLPRT